MLSSSKRAPGDDPRRADSPGVTRSSASDTLLSRYGDLASVEAREAHGPNIAAIVVEPTAGNMGVVPPSDGFLPGLRELSTRHGGAHLRRVIRFPSLSRKRSHLRITPDLTCLGKIGSRFPVGAYGGRTDIMKVAPAAGMYRPARSRESRRHDGRPGPQATTSGCADLARRTSALAAGLAEAARAARVSLRINAGRDRVPPSLPPHRRDYDSALAANTDGVLRFQGNKRGSIRRRRSSRRGFCQRHTDAHVRR